MEWKSFILDSVFEWTHNNLEHYASDLSPFQI